MTVTFEAHFEEGKFLVFNQKPNLKLHRVHQTHSDINITLNQHNCSEEIIGHGDGIIDPNKESILATLTADCIPVLLLGKSANALVHAGWMGVKNKIALSKNIQQHDIYKIFLGPHIRELSFEVQENFFEHFSNQNFYQKRNGKLYFDLTRQLTHDLKLTYPNAEVIDCNLDTFTQQQFHSFRRNKTKLRNWNIFIPKNCLLKENL